MSRLGIGPHGCLWMRAVCHEAGKEWEAFLSGPASSLKCAGARGLLRDWGVLGRACRPGPEWFCSLVKSTWSPLEPLVALKTETSLGHNEDHGLLGDGGYEGAQ